MFLRNAALPAALVSAMLLAGLTAAPTVQAQPAPAADALTDPAFKGPEVIAFAKIKPGDRVADIVAGRFVRALSGAVGPKGKLYAVMPAEVVAAHHEVEGMLKATAADPKYANVEPSFPPVNALALPAKLDVVFIRQNYHDLYDKFMGPADVPAFNKAVYAALKPGGYYVILDHADAPGTGLSGTEGRHRIDPARVKTDMTAAGFVFDGESPIFANPADDHSKFVFHPSIRGKTDQFLYRFKKPK